MKAITFGRKTLNNFEQFEIIPSKQKTIKGGEDIGSIDVLDV